jgi:hypothetical protein
MAETTEHEAAPLAASHSALSAYLDCPRSYQLARVRRIPRRPGPWLAGGTAVHKTIERYLRAQLAAEGEGS